MEISDKLKEKGWYLSKEGLELLSRNINSNDINALSKKALETDLREIGNGALPSDIAKSKHDSIPGNVVVQITKLRNVAAPKINQESKRFPRLLKLTLTDGKVSVSALEIEHINGLSIDTPPGTKIYLKNGPIKITHNYLLLKPTNANVLGGIVTNLVEKWELERNLSKYAKGSRNATSFSEIGCPPPWVPFGKKSVEKQGSTEEAALKSIQKFMDEKSQKATAEFEALRKENIEQALKDDKNKPKKSFGGGKKKLVDANVQKIMDNGFTQMEAENALKYTKHNVERALKNLQYKAENQPTAVKNERFEKRRGKKDAEESKPSTGKISLSDFLEDKLPKPQAKPEPVLEKLAQVNNFQSAGQNAYQQHTQNPRFNQNGPRKNMNRNNDYNQRSNTNGSYRNEDRPNHYEKRNDRTNHYEKRNDDRTNHYEKRNDRPNHYEKRNEDRPNHFEKRNDENRPNHYEKRNDDNRPNHYEKRNENRPNHYEKRNDYVNNKPDQRQPYRNQNNIEYRAERMQNQTNFPEFPAPNNMSDLINKTANMSLSNESNSKPNAFDQKHNQDQNTMQFGQSKPPAFKSKSVNIKGFQNKQINDNAKEMINSASFSNNKPTSNPQYWKWRIGDRCLAKYWEDKKYYDAEVTGVSDKTCVVRFLEYGNFEEINKSDCLPVTPENVNFPVEKQDFRPKNNKASSFNDMRRPPPPFSRKQEESGPIPSQHRNKPMRNTQSIYVPPAQRN